jgi:putative hydrolase of the HAD superfamily
MSPEHPNISAVLFDFGGVIIDSPFEAFDRYEREHGLERGFIRTLNSSNHDANAWARFERSELMFDEFCEAFEKEASAAGGTVNTRDLFAMLSGSVRPEMVEAVRRCSKQFKTALLTNNFVAAEVQFGGQKSDREEVLSLFDVIIESSALGIRKPDPRFYLLACEELAIRPDQAVFLDDLGVNLKPARELGMVTIKVENTERALSELEAVIGIELR